MKPQELGLRINYSESLKNGLSSQIMNTDIDEVVRMESDMNSVILNSLVMDNYFEKQVEEKKLKTAEDLRKEMEA